MPIQVVNVGMFERDASGARTTNITKTISNQGTVRVVYQGIEYVFGPGDSKNFSDAGIAAAVVAADARLRVADARDGLASGGAS